MKSEETSEQFQGEMNELEKVLDRCPVGTKRSLSDQNLAESGSLSFEELAGEEQHEKKEKSSIQNTQTGHRRSKPNHAD